MRQLIENVLALVVVLAPDGRLLEANRAALDLGGFELEELRHRPFWDCPWWQHDAELRRWVRASVERAAQGAVIRADVTVATRPGGRLALDFMLAPLRDAQGEIAQLVASAVDITDRKAGIDALRRSERRFRQVVEGSPGPTALVDRNARITLVNGALEALFGAPRERLIGASIDVLIPARYRERHGKLFQSFFAAPRARDMAGRKALNALRANGEVFPVEIALNPVELGGELQVIATIIDISATRAAQEALERALADKTALLAEVHHRVKNNLQVISSLLNLQHRLAPAGAQHALAESQLRVRAMALIHELLYEQGEVANISLSEYLQRLVRLLQESTGGVGAAVRLAFHHDGFEIALDAQRAVPCGLLVAELVTNAYKHAFADRRAGRIDVELAPHGGGVRLSVVDDGVGLPEGLEPGRTRSLGFQLIPMLVDQMSAQLRIGSGPGSRFDLFFAT
ncbi:MAG TPA: PAS domain S-box protein [Gammaproteobacteria bacterium]|nr:PAS domain S-box protein [Gammaproteobacteria bacterium]